MILFTQKIKDFQGPKTNFKYFQGLEISVLKLKGFQVEYDTDHFNTAPATSWCHA